MRRTKTWLLMLFIAFAVIQFIQPARNQSGQVLQTDITKVYPVPAGVRTILESACYDCHSNTTRYPWYSYIQPAGWWLVSHIREGKEELNFSDFGSYSSKRRISKLRSIESSIHDGTMPLSSYTSLHKEARLTEEEKQLVTAWAGKLRDSLAAAN
ncbi:heme-binding domain-containing protein [Chitinophaga filiformis]|uniref:heme-binding domain-containing protein n=1 Tax=Chitinophaga filiformis TaxID=104663 RepID=UPI001F398625|nr:heme-binding domain-containing protein [Chitinophaga filiformis]MCF6404627.1 heme-binding domain-containing protein [Chitinophaga filiformis]